MPELPAVEIQRRNLGRWSRGRCIARVQVLDARVLRGISAAAFARRLKGREIKSVERKGKQLLLILDQGEALASHLRMSGKWLHDEGEGEAPAQTRVIFHLEGGARIYYRDPRVFGRLQLGPAAALREELFGALGPDPLEPGWGPKLLGERVAHGKRAIKLVLMDQHRVAGIGNIHASEALWLARIHPARPAGSLTPAELRRLATAIPRSLKEAIEDERGEVVQYVGEPGVSNSFHVYGHEGEPCPRCGRPIKRILLGKRSTFFCPHCQPPP